MPEAKYNATRTATRSDGRHVGPAVREVVRLMLEEGMTWRKAADKVGLSHRQAQRALEKPHVITYRRNEKAKLVENLSARVPLKLSELMDSDNAVASVRAALALEQMAQEGRGEPTRRIATGGILIVLGNPQQALPGQPAPPVTIEHTAQPQLIEQNATDDE